MASILDRGTEIRHERSKNRRKLGTLVDTAIRLGFFRPMCRVDSSSTVSGNRADRRAWRGHGRPSLTRDGKHPSTGSALSTHVLDLPGFAYGPALKVPFPLSFVSFFSRYFRSRSPP